MGYRHWHLAILLVIGDHPSGDHPYS